MALQTLSGLFRPEPRSDITFYIWAKQPALTQSPPSVWEWAGPGPSSHSGTDECVDWGKPHPSTRVYMRAYNPLCGKYGLEQFHGNSILNENTYKLWHITSWKFGQVNHNSICNMVLIWNSVSILMISDALDWCSDILLRLVLYDGNVLSVGTWCLLLVISEHWIKLLYCTE